MKDTRRQFKQDNLTFMVSNACLRIFLLFCIKVTLSFGKHSNIHVDRN